jgi:hypothetical protein
LQKKVAKLASHRNKEKRLKVRGLLTQAGGWCSRWREPSTAAGWAAEMAAAEAAVAEAEGAPGEVEAGPDFGEGAEALDVFVAAEVPETLALADSIRPLVQTLNAIVGEADRVRGVAA